MKDDGFYTYILYDFELGFTGQPALEFIFDTPLPANAIYGKELSGNKYVHLASGAEVRRMFADAEHIATGDVIISINALSGSGVVSLLSSTGATIATGPADTPLLYSLTDSGETFGGFSIASVGGVLDIDSIFIETSVAPRTHTSEETSSMLTGRGVPTQYWISLPVGYDPNRATSYPVFMYNPRPDDFTLDWQYEQQMNNLNILRGDRPFIIAGMRLFSHANQFGELYNGVLAEYAEASQAYNADNVDPWVGEAMAIDLFKQIARDYNALGKFYFGGNHSQAGHAMWPVLANWPQYMEAVSAGDPNYFGKGPLAPDYDGTITLGRFMNRPINNTIPERVELAIKIFADALTDVSGGPDGRIREAQRQFNEAGFNNMELIGIDGHFYMAAEQLDFFYEHYQGIGSNRDLRQRGGFDFAGKALNQDALYPTDPGFLFTHDGAFTSLVGDWYNAYKLPGVTIIAGERCRKRADNTRQFL
jgi:hypothetical protein